MSRAMERVMASVNVARIWLWNPDLTVFPSWSLGQWEMGRRWTQLPSKMQSSICGHLLTRVVLSSMFHQGDGWLEASILPATSPSSWKEMPSSLELRSVILYLLPMTLFCIFFSLHCILLLLLSVSEVNYIFSWPENMHAILVSRFCECPCLSDQICRSIGPHYSRPCPERNPDWTMAIPWHACQSGKLLIENNKDPRPNENGETMNDKDLPVMLLLTYVLPMA